MFIILLSFLNVTVNAATVFSEVKFLDCLHRFFDSGVLRTFRRFHKLNWTIMLVFDFEEYLAKPVVCNLAFAKLIKYQTFQNFPQLLSR